MRSRRSRATITKGCSRRSSSGARPRPTPPRPARPFLAFWSSDGAHHFHVEEDILLPAFARRVGPDHQEIVRTLVEHVDLRRRAADVANDAQPPLEDLHELGERLSEHIRHEENVLFGLIESALPEPELVALGEAVGAA